MKGHHRNNNILVTSTTMLMMMYSIYNVVQIIVFIIMLSSSSTTAAININNSTSNHVVMINSSSLPLSSRNRQLRGSTTSQMVTESSSSNNKILCRIVEVDTMFVKEDKDNDVDDNESKNKGHYSCAPIVLNNDKYHIETDDLYKLYDLPVSMIKQHRLLFIKGKLFVLISNAIIRKPFGIITNDDTTYQLYNYNNIRMDDDNDNSNDRRLDGNEQNSQLDWKEHMTIAIIRVSTLDASPIYTAAELSSFYFDTNGINIMTQYQQCSAGQLNFRPSLLQRGIFDITIQNSISQYSNSYENLVDDAQDILKLKYPNITSINKIANRIIFCLPDGTGSWAASAGIRHWRINMNNKWCKSLTGTMHELGHTMGLYHSHANGEEYKDRTGYMGSGGTDAITPQKCFNAYQLYQFNWFPSNTLYIDPTNNGGYQIIKLVAFVDHNYATSNNEKILINIIDTYFLTYNRAKSYNIGTEQLKNEVTITSPAAGGGTELNDISLVPGSGTFTVSNIKGSGRNMIIEACYSTSTSTGADMMILSIGLDASQCSSAIQTNKPTNKPTSSPITPSPISSSPITPAPIAIQLRPTSPPITSPPITASPITSGPISIQLPKTPAPISVNVPKPTSSPITLQPSMIPTSIPITISDEPTSDEPKNNTPKPTFRKLTSKPSDVPTLIPTSAPITPKPTFRRLTSKPSVEPSTVPVIVSSLQPSMKPSSQYIVSKGPSTIHSKVPSNVPSVRVSDIPTVSSEDDNKPVPDIQTDFWSGASNAYNNDGGKEGNNNKEEEFFSNASDAYDDGNKKKTPNA